MASPSRRSQRLADTQVPDMKDPDDLSESSESDDDCFLPTPKRQAGSGRRSPGEAPARTPLRKEPAAEDADLLAKLDSHPKDIIKEIITAYSDSTESSEYATVTMLNVVSQFAGRRAESDWSKDYSHDYVDDSIEDLANGLMDQIKAAGTDHFRLTTKSGSSRKSPVREKLRKKLSNFWHMLTTQAHSSNLDVLEMFDPVTDLCTLLSGSLAWCTRYAAVTVALGIMTGMVDIVVLEEERERRLNRQLQLATARSGKKLLQDGSQAATTSPAASAKTAALQRDVAAVHARVSTTAKRVEALFEIFVVARFRDVVPWVRQDVVSAVGAWVLRCPSRFLGDKFLKYIAWGLSDMDAGVRLTAVQANARLLKDEDNVQALGLFLERFRSRLVELTRDKSTDVRLAALEVQERLLHAHKVELHQLVQLTRLWQTEPGTAAEQAVQQAAAEVLALAINNQAKARLASAAAGRDHNEVMVASESLAALTVLRTLFRALAAETPATAADALGHDTMLLLVKCLMPHVPVMEDWQALTGCLDTDISGQLPPVEIQDLVTLLACCVEHAVAVERAGGAKPRRSATGGVHKRGNAKPRKEKAAVEQASAAMECTLVLMDALQGLLQQFAAEPHLVRELLRVVPCMDMKLYVAQRREVAFQALVSDICGLFERIYDEDALSCCVMALSYCCALDPPDLADTAMQAAGVLLETCVERLDHAAVCLGSVADAELRAATAQMAATAAELKSSESVNVVYGLDGAVRRITRLAMNETWNHRLVCEDRVWGSLHDVVAALVYGRPVPVACVVGSMWALYYLNLANVQRVVAMASEAGTGLSQAGMDADWQLAAKRCNETANQIVAVLNLPAADMGVAAVHATSPPVHHDACMMLCRLITLCNAPTEDGCLERMRVTVTHDVRDACWLYVERLFDAKAEICREIADLDDKVDYEGELDSQAVEQRERLQAYDGLLLQRCEDAICALMNPSLSGALGDAREFVVANILAHAPLLDGRLEALIKRFVMWLRQLQPDDLPSMLVLALRTVFDELSQVDDSRYGVTDFEEIAKCLAEPLQEVVTSESIMRSFWARAVAYVQEAPAERAEFLAYAVIHFVHGLSSQAAIEALARFEAPDELEEAVPTKLGKQLLDAPRIQEFLEELRRRATKPPPKPALKKTARKRASGATKPEVRKITFQDRGNAADADASPLRQGRSATRVSQLVGRQSTRSSSRPLAAAPDGWLHREEGSVRARAGPDLHVGEAGESGREGSLEEDGSEDAIEGEPAPTPQPLRTRRASADPAVTALDDIDVSPVHTTSLQAMSSRSGKRASKGAGGHERRQHKASTPSVQAAQRSSGEAPSEGESNPRARRTSWRLRRQKGTGAASVQGASIQTTSKASLSEAAGEEESPESAPRRAARRTPQREASLARATRRSLRSSQAGSVQGPGNSEVQEHEQSDQDELMDVDASQPAAPASQSVPGSWMSMPSPGVLPDSFLQNVDVEPETEPQEAGGEGDADMEQDGLGDAESQDSEPEATALAQTLRARRRQ